MFEYLHINNNNSLLYRISHVNRPLEASGELSLIFGYTGHFRNCFDIPQSFQEMSD